MARGILVRNRFEQSDQACALHPAHVPDTPERRPLFTRRKRIQDNQGFAAPQNQTNRFALQA